MRVLNIFKKFFERNTITHLGRWEHRVDDKKKYMRATYANLDHCGDIICGKPQFIKESIDKVTKSKD